tara:strand:+ start:2989 stop:3687 length:699 start_codon:yes stop_codon:yes gene_type:complete
MSSENSTVLVICLVAILLIALLVNYYVHQMQQQKLQRTLLVKKLRFEAGHILDALATLKQLQCPAEAIALLNKGVIEILEKLTRLKPQSGMIEQIQSQIPTAAGQQQSLNLENDSAMKKAHSAIRFAIRFVHQRRSLGALSGIQCDEITKQLQWLDSKIEIDTHIELGNRLLSNDKKAVAISKFKQAKGVIARLPHKNPQKTELMTEINQRIAQALPFATPTIAAETKTEND